MNQEEKKKAAAQAALQYIEDDMIVGVGTGSTVNYFIEALATSKLHIEGAIPSSDASEALLRKYHIPVIDINSQIDIPVYVDGADEATEHKHLIKGGGGALTREKIVAAISQQFVCIMDDSKQVDMLGKFPLPVEVIPMARSYVARELAKLGGLPELRAGFTTDNGNVILDVKNLKIQNPVELEEKINQLTGVVTNGLFAKRGADILLVADNNGVSELK